MWIAIDSTYFEIDTDTAGAHYALPPIPRVGAVYVSVADMGSDTTVTEAIGG